MRKRISWLCLALLLIPALVWGAAGTITWTPAKWQEPGSKKVSRVYTVTLTSGSAGETISGASAAAIHGWVVRVTVDPDDTNFPADNWDLTISDGNISDILRGAGGDLDTDVKTPVELSLYGPDGATVMGLIRVDSALTVAGANMGNSKIAVVKIYVVE